MRTNSTTFVALVRLTSDCSVSGSWLNYRRLGTLLTQAQFRKGLL